MSTDLKKPFIFRHSMSRTIRAAVGCVCLIVIVLAILERGGWIVAAAFSSFGFCLLRALANARIEIFSDGFSYRGLDFKGTHAVRFDEIEKGYFEEDRRGEVPVAAFYVQLRDGHKLQIPLRLFPVEASALLFRQLDRYRISIPEPDTLLTQRARDEIRRCRSNRL